MLPFRSRGETFIRDHEGLFSGQEELVPTGTLTVCWLGHQPEPPSTKRQVLIISERRQRIWLARSVLWCLTLRWQAVLAPTRMLKGRRRTALFDHVIGLSGCPVILR